MTDIIHPCHSVVQGNSVLERTGIKTVPLNFWVLSFPWVHQLTVTKIVCIYRCHVSLFIPVFLTWMPHRFFQFKFYPHSNMKPWHSSFLPSSCNMYYLYILFGIVEIKIYIEHLLCIRYKVHRASTSSYLIFTTNPWDMYNYYSQSLKQWTSYLTKVKEDAVFSLWLCF